MVTLTTPAILIRRLNYGDNDLIITFYTLEQGKMAVMAKSAKKSVKRFGGILEPFSVLQVVCRQGRGKGLPLLQEAALVHPFDEIRTDVVKTAYASYWAEIVHNWSEQHRAQEELFRLLMFALGQLDRGRMAPPVTSILFQMRFLNLAGIGPHLNGCHRCGLHLDRIQAQRISFDLSSGGILCQKCTTGPLGRQRLAKGSLKQLQWIGSGELAKTERIRFSPQAMREAQDLMEAFVPYHLGKKPRSLEILKQLRCECAL